MQLCKKRDKVYRLYLEGLEYENIKKSLEYDLNIGNIQLCYYIENELPKRFEECKDKRIFINGINASDNYLCATISLQDVKIGFKKPKIKSSFFRVTDVTFDSKEVFAKWLEKNHEKYTYRVKTCNTDRVNVIIFNMDIQDEMKLSLFQGRINKVNTLAEYVLLESVSRFKKYIKAFT